jgi:hypothetical protein
MIEHTRNEPFNHDDGNGALPCNDLHLQTRHTARHTIKQPLCLFRSNCVRRKCELMQWKPISDEFRHLRRRAPGQIGLQPIVYILGAEREVGRGPTHVDGAQRVERKPECYAVHSCYHRLGDVRCCADGILEDPDMGARWERTAAWVRMLGKCVQINSGVTHPGFVSRWEGRGG